MRTLAILAVLLVLPAGAQQPFELDPSFRTAINRSNVNSIWVQPDGRVIASGRMRYDGQTTDKLLLRLLPDGQLDPTYAASGLGGGEIKEHAGAIYVGNQYAVRRILPDGQNDPSFLLGTAPVPYFGAAAMGDFLFHEEGMILSGQHLLEDTVRGFTGLHAFIWFNLDGTLDTTRIHHQANGTIREMEWLPDGKIIASGSLSSYDGQPTGRVLRLHPDGSLDTSFQTDVFWGRIYTFVPLADGRVYAGGLFQMVGLPGYVSLVRLMPDGSLDPTFNNDPEMELGELTGLAPMVIQILPLPTGELVVVGSFRTVDGHPRNSIGMLDSTGQVMETFEAAGCGSFVQNEMTSGSIAGIIQAANGMFYLCGAYHGYSDGTTNDPLQRMVTRLHGGDLGTALPQEKAAHHVRAYPNPASTYLVVEHALAHAPGNARVELRDALGRPMLSAAVTQAEGQVVLDLRGLAAGAYTTVVLSGGALIHSKVVMVQ